MRRTLPTLLTLAASALAAAPALAQDGKPKVLIITGDEVGAHDWKSTSAALKEVLSEGGKMEVDLTTTPAKDLTDENLAKYDALVLNYVPSKKTEGTEWTDANKKAFLKAVREGGKGLVAYHLASASFTRPNWAEFEKAVAGGWRTVGFHGPAHEFTVSKVNFDHPISNGAPEKFDHVADELYSNCMLTPGSVVLATAYCDASKPKGTGKDEAVIWVNNYGKGRVFECVLGHDVKALTDKPVAEWLRRGVEWAATGKVTKPASGG